MSVPAAVVASPAAESRKVRSSPVAAPAATAPTIAALQIGLGWFPEHPGGLDRYYYELLQALPAHGVKCHGLVVGSGAAAGTTGGRVRAFAGEAATLPRRLLAVRAAVSQAIARGEADLVVSHFALYAAGAVGVMRRVPAVVHFHGPWAAEARAEGAGRAACWMKALVERAVYRRARRLVCLSESFAQILCRDYRVPVECVRVVPGGVDVERFNLSESRTAARDRLGWPASRPIVFCVRRLVNRMGLGNLVEAAATVRRNVPDALVLIAGRGHLSEALRNRIADAGLDETVKLLGYVPDSDLRLAYRAADLTVVPSTELEGFGLVAAESLAAGTPALVSPVGGLPDVVRGLAPDWILPDTSAARLADGLTDALTGRLRAVPAERCAAYARESFDWSIIAARVAAVYAEAIGVSN